MSRGLFTRQRIVQFLSICLMLEFAILSSILQAGELADRLEPLIKAFDGEIGLKIKQLESGEEFTYQSTKPMPTASLIKLPILVTAYQAIEDGKLSLDQPITLKKEDKVPGSGILTPHFSEGTRLTLYDAIELMIVYSDNTATNLVIDQIGLPTTTELMKSLGCETTVLNSLVYRRDTSIFPERSKEFGLGSTCAEDMVSLLEKLQEGTLVGEGASKRMLAHLLACESKSRIPRLLPPSVQVAHKTGSVSDTRCDAGLIISKGPPIAICILTSELGDRSWSDDNPTDLFCAEVAKIAYEYFSAMEDKSEATDGPQTLRSGANGLLVEALQRTLNARLKPSPDIGVDGDFGPQTEQTVVAFQKHAGLPETGVVDAETWAALGTLVEEQEAPDPAKFNAKKIKKASADKPTDPPIVTCKAWAIGDSETGELLWSFNEDERRDIASTTKMMTCYLVVKYAQEHPEVLDEIVEFSQRADETSGSTSGVRTGEKLPVGELLYGLMLPSGNDASVALAEQFGSRITGHGPEKDKKKNYDDFIEAMNAAAKELGMTRSRFKNTHGLPQEGHQSTAADLLKLATAAMKYPLFRKLVSTPQHGYTVTGPGGYKRNLAWKNTNRLLKIDGYDGIKTGTTNAAGACLASQATRNGKSLTMIVLGATSSDGRYADSRNLYHWAWQQLEQESGGQ